MGRRGRPRLSMATGQSKIDRAIEHGYIQPGWFLEDYIRDAIDNQGWESFLFWAPKGSLKSNFELQVLYQIYRDWEKALTYCIASPLQYIKVMSALGKYERLPLLIWDDITRHLPKTLYFSNRPLYEAIKKYWPVTRSRFNTFICSAPNKEEVLDFIIQDMMGELFFDRRIGGKTTGRFDFQRHCWSIDFESPRRARFEMVRVERSEFPMRPEDADAVYQRECERAEKEGRDPRPRLPGVPLEIFKRYWQDRMDLAKTADDELMVEFKRLMERAEPPQVEESEASAAGRLLAEAKKAKKMRGVQGGVPL